MKQNENWTPEEIDWLRENYGTMSNKKLTNVHNTMFIERSESSIKSKASKLGFSKNIFTWSEEETKWIHDNYKNLGREETVKQFNRLFSPRSKQSIISKIINDKLTLTNECRARIVSECKTGTGAPIGTIREIPSGHNLTALRIKTKNGWVNYPRYFWKKNKGHLPDDYYVLFLDGNNKNVCLENMVAIPRGTVWSLRDRGWLTDNYMFNLTAITCQELMNVLNSDKRCIFGGDHIAKNNKKT